MEPRRIIPVTYVQRLNVLLKIASTYDFLFFAVDCTKNNNFT